MVLVRRLSSLSLFHSSFFVPRYCLLVCLFVCMSCFISLFLFLSFYSFRPLEFRFSLRLACKMVRSTFICGDVHYISRNMYFFVPPVFSVYANVYLIKSYGIRLRLTILFDFGRKFRQNKSTSFDCSLTKCII